ncbi:SWI SNF complex subunit SWI3B [Olea europaea subsp. europaea]|uniref:SWI SNF complex subunit SWI3B n=1 Tax=Olea europaea subsp. europaea TaxID=158383 RepID=A0A8S0TA10_OLEEU|nr:SWI SNF complex subunit SWI3B [Olea europaea subsp. europaea]
MKSPSTPTPEPSAGNPITDAPTATITIDLTPPSDSKANLASVTPTPTPNPTPITVTAAATTTSTATGRTHPVPPFSDADVIHIPSYSRWFSWNRIHECEFKFVPEFFDGRSPSKNPGVYKYYRNASLGDFEKTPPRKLPSLRIFDFLEAWGLINYTGSSKPQLKWEEESKVVMPLVAVAPVTVSKSKPCSNCKGICSFACFASDKHDMRLCASCNVRGNYRESLEFKRVEISEEAKTDWTDKETLQLLEAIMHYGDDWKKVAVHVGGRSEKQCVTHFVNFPFGEQFDGPSESSELDAALSSQDLSRPTKRMCLTPLSDFSNPIMAQDISSGCFSLHFAALSALGDIKLKESLTSGASKQQESDFASNGDDLNSMEGALSEVRLQLKKEDEELEKAISGIAVQTKEFEDKIVQFEEFDLHMERKLQKLQQLQNLLFVDHSLFHFIKHQPHQTPVKA